MKDIVYRTKGTCSREIHIKLDDENVISFCEFIGGCAGNTTGLARLVIGMSAQDAIQKLKGIPCGVRNTSCPDQLARALESNL